MYRALRNSIRKQINVTPLRVRLQFEFHQVRGNRMNVADQQFNNNHTTNLNYVLDDLNQIEVRYQTETLTDVKDDPSPDLSVSFQAPRTPHLNRYSHSGQIPSCDARRSCSLKNVTSEDVNVTASPVLPGSPHHSFTNHIVDDIEPQQHTPIKRLDYAVESDDASDDWLTQSLSKQARASHSSFTSTPDPKSLEKRQTLDMNQHQIFMQSPIKNIDDKMSASFISELEDMERMCGHIQGVAKQSDNVSSNQYTIPNRLSPADSLELLSSLLPPNKTYGGLLGQSQSARYQGDPTLVAENNVLKEGLEKERYRRKHCEDHIQILNAKMLELQQELAVTVATDTRKATVIEQLQKHFAKLMEGWKKRDIDKDTLISRLKEEKSSAEQQIQQHEHMVQKFKEELSVAINDLKKERDSAKTSILQLNSQISHVKEELKHAEAQTTNERERAEIMQSQWEKERDMNKLLQSECETSQAQLQQEKERLKETEKDLRDAMETMVTKHESECDELKSQVTKQTQQVDELAGSLRSSQNECKTLDMKIQCHKTELEGLKVTMALSEAKYENQLKVMEVELRTQIEKETAHKILEMHRKMEASEHSLQQSHQSQILDQNEQHSTEVKMLTVKLDKSEDSLRSLQTEFDDKLNENHNEIQTLKREKSQLQVQRSEALQRLQHMMQTEWQEAQTLLSSPTKKPSSSYENNISHQESPEHFVSNQMNQHNITSLTNPSEHSFLSTKSLSSNHSSLIAPNIPADSCDTINTQSHNPQNQLTKQFSPLKLNNQSRSHTDAPSNHGSITSHVSHRSNPHHSNQATLANRSLSSSTGILLNSQSRTKISQNSNVSPQNRQEVPPSLSGRGILVNRDQQHSDRRTSQDSFSSMSSVKTAPTTKENVFSHVLLPNLLHPAVSQNSMQSRISTRPVNQNISANNIQDYTIKQPYQTFDYSVNLESAKFLLSDDKNLNYFPFDDKARDSNEDFDEHNNEYRDEYRDEYASDKTNTNQVPEHVSESDFFVVAENENSTKNPPSFFQSDNQSKLFQMNEHFRKGGVPVSIAKMNANSSWMLGNTSEMDSRSVDEEDGMFSPMPDFSDDESTVAERDCDENISVLRQQLSNQPVTPTSNTLSLTLAGIGLPGKPNLVNNERLNTSHTESVNTNTEVNARQNELSYYVNMLLQQPPKTARNVRSDTSIDQSPPDWTNHPPPESNQYYNAPYQQPASTERLWTEEKLGELSRLLSLYEDRQQQQDAIDQELANVAEKDTGGPDDKPQSSPKTKPRQARAPSRKVKRVTSARSSTQVSTLAPNIDADKPRQVKTSRRSISTSGPRVSHNKSTRPLSVWK